MSAMSAPLDLSIIVPAYDEAALIGATLDALRAAAEALGVAYEIVVVDDASTDGTGDLARERGARVHRVERRQIAVVRNDGAAVAHGRRFLFVDADTVIEPDTLRATWDAWEAGAVGGGAAIGFEGHIPIIKRVIVNVSSRLFQVFKLTGGCYIFSTREAFEDIGGFDDTLFASEEIELTKALKQRGRFVIVRPAVVTSGRKLRQYRLRELLGIIARQGIKGPRRAWRSREGLDVWYGARQPDE